MPGTFEPVEHTADRALRIFGRDPAELFNHAVEGMLSLLTDPAAVRPVVSRPLRARASQLSDLLVAILNEALFRFDTERFLCRRLDIRTLAPHRVEAVGWGEIYDPARHEIRTVVKAATYHQLALLETKDGLEITIVFDV